MNIQEIVSVVTLGINVAAVGYIYGQMKEQLKNQNATLETFKQNFNEKFKDFKEAVSEHFVRVEKKQDIHNRIIERTYNLERQANVQDEQIKVINHRIEDLEELNKCQ